MIELFNGFSHLKSCKATKCLLGYFICHFSLVFNLSARLETGNSCVRLKNMETNKERLDTCKQTKIDTKNRNPTEFI